METIKQFFVKMWKWLNGKKTYIGALAVLTIQILVWCKVPIPEAVVKQLYNIIAIWIAGAAFHKGKKIIKPKIKDYAYKRKLKQSRKLD